MPWRVKARRQPGALPGGPSVGMDQRPPEKAADRLDGGAAADIGFGRRWLADLVLPRLGGEQTAQRRARDRRLEARCAGVDPAPGDVERRAKGPGAAHCADMDAPREWQQFDDSALAVAAGQRGGEAPTAAQRQAGAERVAGDEIEAQWNEQARIGGIGRGGSV